MIDEKELNNEEYLIKVKMEAEDIISENRFREAFDLSEELKKAIESVNNFKENYYELFIEYKKIIVKLRWVGLPVATEETVINMFKNYFVEIFTIPDFQVWEKLLPILQWIRPLENRDVFKKNIRDALLMNKQKITGKKLIIGREEKEPTITNWFLDYNRAVGALKVNSLARTQYFINGVNIKNLSQEEKARVKTLFDLYEKLKISSATLEGYEEDIPVDDEGQEGNIRGGVFEPLPKLTAQQKLVWEIAQEVVREREARESNIKEMQGSLNNYAVGSLERKAIEEEIKKIFIILNS